MDDFDFDRDRYGVHRGVEHIPLRGQPGEMLGRIVPPPVRVDRTSSDDGEGDER